MNDTAQNTVSDEQERPALPDRLSVNPRSPHYMKEIFQCDVGIKLNGKDRFDVKNTALAKVG